MGTNSRIIDFSGIDNIDADSMGKIAHKLGELKHLNIPTPDGFVIMPSLFRDFLEETGIFKNIKKIQSVNHPAIENSMSKLFEPIQKKIMNTRLPSNITKELNSYYRKLSGIFKEQSLNIFTSPLRGKSLRFFDIKGDANMILTIKKIWAANPEHPSPIIIQKRIKPKIKGKIATNNLLIDEELVAIVKKIKKYFYFPQEIEYAIEKNKIYVISIKPLTTQIPEKERKSDQVKINQKVLAKGIPLNPGVVTGQARILRNQDYYQIRSGEIAVISQLNKTLYSRISKAKGVVVGAELFTDCEKALYRKNIKIPTIIGVKNAINVLQNKSIITVNGISGEIYSGGLSY